MLRHSDGVTYVHMHIQKSMHDYHVDDCNLQSIIKGEGAQQRKKSSGREQSAIAGRDRLATGRAGRLTSKVS